MRFKVSDIAYDTDEEGVDLASELVLEISDDAEPSTALADAVSDRTGFCVRGLSFEPST